MAGQGGEPGEVGEDRADMEQSIEKLSGARILLEGGGEERKACARLAHA